MHCDVRACKFTVRNGNGESLHFCPAADSAAFPISLAWLLPFILIPMCAYRLLPFRTECVHSLIMIYDEKYNYCELVVGPSDAVISHTVSRCLPPDCRPIHLGYICVRCDHMSIWTNSSLSLSHVCCCLSRRERPAKDAGER